MHTFQRDHPIWTSVIGLFTWMVSTVPVAFTAWWLLFKGGTIPEWLSHHGVGFGVIALLIAAWFMITAVLVIVSFARTVSIVTELGPWHFEPTSVSVRMVRINAERLKPTYTAPYIAFTIHVINGSGRSIYLTHIDGQTACNQELCALPLILSARQQIGNGGEYQLHCRQGVSMDMARTLLDELLAPRRIVRFEFNTAQLIGQIGKLAVSIPLQKASFSFKGPISLQGNDQDQIRRIEDVVVSGTHYDHCGGQL